MSLDMTAPRAAIFPSRRLGGTGSIFALALQHRVDSSGLHMRRAAAYVVVLLVSKMALS